MRTIILRLADQAADDELHGVLESPGGAAVPFTSAAELVALLTGRQGPVATAAGGGPPAAG